MNLLTQVARERERLLRLEVEGMAAAAHRTEEEERRRRSRAVMDKYRALLRAEAERAARARECDAMLASARHAVESWLARLVVFGDVCTDERPDGGLVRSYVAGSSAVFELDERGTSWVRGHGPVPVYLGHDEEIVLGFARIERDDLGLLARLDLAEPAPPGFRGLSAGFSEWTTERVGEHVEDGRTVEVRRVVSATVAEVSLVPEPAFPQSRLLQRVLGPRARSFLRSLGYA